MCNCSPINNNFLCALLYIFLPAGADKAAIEATAAASPEVEKFSEGRTPKKIIVVPGRLVNVVV